MLETVMNAQDAAVGREGAQLEDDLRQQISALLLDRAATIVGDAVGVFPFTSSTELDGEYCQRVGMLLIELSALAIRHGKLDTRVGLVADLHRLVLDRALPVEQLFTFVYLIERTALDEIALSDALGATS